jgi:hypothetical protein
LSEDTACLLLDGASVPDFGKFVPVIDNQVILENIGHKNIKGKGLMNTFTARWDVLATKRLPNTPPTTTSF